MPGNDYRKRVGRRIRRARQRKEWSQTQLAQAMSVADAQISRWETGRVMPSPRNLQRIGEALDVPAETFLMVGEDEDLEEPEPSAGMSARAKLGQRLSAAEQFAHPAV